MAKVQKPTGTKVSRTELIQRVLDSGRAMGGVLHKGQVKEILDAYEEEIAQALKAGSNVATALGVFKRKDKPAKPARKAFTGPDPFNKGAMKDFPARPAQPAKAGAKFQPGKTLREALA